MTNPSTTRKPRTRIDRTLAVVLIAIGVLVATALLVVFARGPVTPLPSTSPQGVVQRYASAAIAGETTQASTLLSPDWLTSCDPLNTYSGADTVGNSVRVTLVGVTERPDSADVHVLITTTYQGGFLGTSSNSSEGLFKLTKSDHRWLIDSVPWELAVCPKDGAAQ